jgi:hypothetical protein
VKRQFTFLVFTAQLFSFFFFYFTATSFAEPFFNKILEGISHTLNISSFNLPGLSQFGRGNFQTKIETESQNTNTEVVPTRINQKEKVNTDEKNIDEQNSSSSKKVIPPTNTLSTYLNSVLQKLGISPTTQIRVQPGANTQTTSPQSQNISSNPAQSSQAQQTPPQQQNQKQQNQNPLSQLTNSLMSGINKAAQQQNTATPYNGPGGSLPGDCGIPKGPMAYNIGGTNGTGSKCDAKTVFVGYKQNLPTGKFGGGYINPMTEKGTNLAGSSLNNCAQKGVASQYGEKCFSDYSSGPGFAYIQEQLLHFQKEGARVGQKCVPVDIDNCDSIGANNYKAILDAVEKLNNGADIKIKVMAKNPQLAGCNFLSHPAVVGAFVESATTNEAQQIAKMRSKPEQILLFARGGGGTNRKLQDIEKLNIPNSAYSYDSGREYENVDNCTYKP